MGRLFEESLYLATIFIWSRDGGKKGKLHFPPRCKFTHLKFISRMLNVYKRLVMNAIVSKIIIEGS